MSRDRSREAETTSSRQQKLEEEMFEYFGETKSQYDVRQGEFLLQLGLIRTKTVHHNGQNDSRREKLLSSTFSKNCEPTHTIEKPFQSDSSEKTSTQKPRCLLDRHIPIHTGKKTFQCTRQGKKTFSQKYSLPNHIQIHTRENLFQCDDCERTFSRKCDLARHAKVHTGKRLSQFSICEKIFPQKHHLEEQNQTNDIKAKLFERDVCKKSFSYRSSFAAHQRIHTGEKPFHCDVCKKSFLFRSHLVIHQRTHTGEKPYLCDVCEKSFSQRTQLVRHQKTHTGEKPYLCDVCKKSFSDRSNLVQHERIHTGEKPYLCDVCKKSFSNQSNFAKHRRTHTERNNHRYH